MPNITVTVDESVYTNARIAAAIRRTNVTQLVRKYLEALSRQAAQALESGCGDPAVSFDLLASTMDSAPEMPFLRPNRRPKRHV